jgi:hypothetical protein
LGILKNILALFEQKLRAIENRPLILAKTEICGFLSKNHHGGHQKSPRILMRRKITDLWVFKKIF